MPKFGLSVLLALICAVLAAPSALARDVPTLEARAILPADATAPAPFPGAPNAEPIAAAGATQPVGGFSALLDAAGRNTFWAMPDNGFGSIANSRSFLLRVYRAEFEARQAANLDWVDRTFRSARGEDAVVIAMQADTFFPGGVTTGFDAVIKRISDLARNFDGPVLLLQGDSHRFTIDAPIAAAPNLTRIVVEGETVGEWLRLQIDPDSPGVLTVAREGVD